MPGDASTLDSFPAHAIEDVRLGDLPPASSALHCKWFANV